MPDNHDYGAFKRDNPNHSTLTDVLTAIINKEGKISTPELTEKASKLLKGNTEVTENYPDRIAKKASKLNEETGWQKSYMRYNLVPYALNYLDDQNLIDMEEVPKGGKETKFWESK